MIPFFRTITELQVITEARDKHEKGIFGNEQIHLSRQKAQIKNNDKSSCNKEVKLPKIPKYDRQKWVKRKKAVTNFFDELDYNNQIQSSYDLTLWESQKKYDHHDIA
tara:strand:+ start:510 stop:830 length:321 start_codon:yes stop_codon:yes gene_type:complete